MRSSNLFKTWTLNCINEINEIALEIVSEALSEHLEGCNFWKQLEDDCRIEIRIQIHIGIHIRKKSYQKKKGHQKATWHLAKLKQKLLSNCLRSGHHRSFWIRTLNSNSEIKSCTLAFRLIFEWNFRHLLPFFVQLTGGAYPLTLCVHSNTRPTDLQTGRLHLCELSRWTGALLRCQSVPLARCWWTAFDCHLVMAISYSYPLAQGAPAFRNQHSQQESCHWTIWRSSAIFIKHADHINNWQSLSTLINIIWISSVDLSAESGLVESLGLLDGRTIAEGPFRPGYPSTVQNVTKLFSLRPQRSMGWMKIIIQFLRNENSLSFFFSGKI